MNSSCKTAVAAAMAGGYVLGRTRKARTALAIATFLAGRRFGLSPAGLAAEGMRQLRENPRFEPLRDQISGELLAAARSAASGSAERGFTALAESLRQRGKGRGGAQDEEAEEAEEEPEFEEDEGEETGGGDGGGGAEEEEPAQGGGGREGGRRASRRTDWDRLNGPAKKAAARKRAPAKKSPAKRTAAKKAVPARKKAAAGKKAAADHAGSGRPHGAAKRHGR